MERVSQACGLAGVDLADPLFRTPDDVAQRLWRALAQEWSSEALTLQVARAAPFSCFAGLAEGMQYATNLRQALRLLVKSQVLIADRMKVELIETSEGTMLTGGHPAEEIDQGRTSEMVIALLVRMIREHLGIEDAVERIAFPWGPSGVSAGPDDDGYPARQQALKRGLQRPVRDGSIVIKRALQRKDTFDPNRTDRAKLPSRGD